MGSVGEYLKQAREAQGLNLDQVSALTRIQQPYLLALEEERYAELPEQVFAKGFVRTYARSLGVDEDEALQLFSASAGLFYTRGEEDKRQTLIRIEKARKGKFNWNLVIVITGALLIGLIYLLPREQSSRVLPKSSPSSATQSSSRASEDAASSMIQEDSVAHEVGFLDDDLSQGSPHLETDRLAEIPGHSSPTATSSTVSDEFSGPMASEPTDKGVLPPASVDASLAVDPGGDVAQGLVLELQATEMTWVVIRADQGEPTEALLQPGERARWRASERFFLTLGNAGGVSVTLNGEPRGPFGERGVVMRDIEIAP